MLAALTMLCQTSFAAPQAISSAGLRADVALLRTAFENLHPGLYRYNSKQKMDEQFGELNRRFDSDQTLPEAFLAFTAFTASIRCGHTYPNFVNQKKEVSAALFEGQTQMPFHFRWIDNRMVVTEDFTPEKQLPRGSEILSINGNPTRKILDRLMPLARADGSNDGKRRAYFELIGEGRYEAFHIYFPLLFPFTGPALKLEAKRPSDRKPTLFTVQALTSAQRQAAQAPNVAEPFEWKYLPNGNAYLRMRTWALYNSKWDWKTWLNARLDEFADRNAPALVVDLRGNEGGQDIGNEILKRIVSKDLRVASYIRLVRYRQIEAPLNPHLDTWDNSFRNWGASAEELRVPWPTAPQSRYFRLNKYDDDESGWELIHPEGKHFQGKLFVLIDAANSSATFQFAQTVQQNKLGTLIGRTTGGNQRGINGGAFFFLRLPNSGIEIDLPLIGSFPKTPQPDAGIVPDVAVKLSVGDIAAGVDPDLAAIPAR